MTTEDTTGDETRPTIVTTKTNLSTSSSKRGRDIFLGFLLGAASFVGASYVLHCRFDIGPWPCQSRSSKRCRCKEP